MIATAQPAWNATLRARFAEQDLSIAEVARRLGTYPPVVFNWLRGKYAVGDKFYEQVLELAGMRPDQLPRQQIRNQWTGGAAKRPVPTLRRFGLKRCARCGQFKSDAEFNNRADSPDGKDYYCKACRLEHKRELTVRHRQSGIDLGAARRRVRLALARSRRPVDGEPPNPERMVRAEMYAAAVAAGKPLRFIPSGRRLIAPEDIRGKRCGRCHRTLPIAEFQASRSTYDGYQNKCRACIKACGIRRRLQAAGDTARQAGAQAVAG